MKSLSHFEIKKSNQENTTNVLFSNVQSSLNKKNFSTAEQQANKNFEIVKQKANTNGALQSNSNLTLNSSLSQTQQSQSSAPKKSSLEKPKSNSGSMLNYISCKKANMKKFNENDDSNAENIENEINRLLPKDECDNDWASLSNKKKHAQSTVVAAMSNAIANSSSNQLKSNMKPIAAIRPHV
jgi:hypothetical protein